MREGSKSQSAEIHNETEVDSRLDTSGTLSSSLPVSSKPLSLRDVSHDLLAIRRDLQSGIVQRGTSNGRHSSKESDERQ
ncbi:hypothetical protein WA026_003120 [Henosepilachna vigintioctopunctata]|uniref:Uncharacterized protein n=1 Tax=Henosepilachna vigintioctopunctata TaxID=420089 RepID=A0AAW1TJ01_9CUCU